VRQRGQSGAGNSLAGVLVGLAHIDQDGIAPIKQRFRVLGVDLPQD
jgi:hypothetical protein